MPLLDCGGVILSLPLPQSISEGVSVSLDISVVAGDDATELTAGRFDVKSFDTKHFGVVRPSYEEAHESGLGHSKGDGVWRNDGEGFL